MRKLVCGLLFVVSPWLATLLFWTLFGACVDPGPPSVEVPVVRLVASWDPLACGDPHRVALELEDDDGAKLSASAPCAIGGLTLGMMTRTARGHTGRPLRADGWEVAMFVLIQIAAAVRVFGGMASIPYLASVQASAVLWSAAFGLYAVRYWPVLTRSRLDGQPG